MLSHDITYENFDGETVTETHHFNLTESELVKFNASFGVDGLEGSIQKIIDAEDVYGVLDQLENIVRMSYGERVENSFIKDEERTEIFLQSLAYDALFMDLLSDETKLANFLIGVVPKKLKGAVEEAQSKMEGRPVEDTNILPAPQVTENQ